jgi:hypothetical protein
MLYTLFNFQIYVDLSACYGKGSYSELEVFIQSNTEKFQTVSIFSFLLCPSFLGTSGSLLPGYPELLAVCLSIVGNYLYLFVCPFYLLLPPFQNIRCFSLSLSCMYLDIF